MGDDVEKPDWHEDAPEHKPTVGEDGAWGGDWRNYYDAATGDSSRKAGEDAPHSGAHQAASTLIPDDGHSTYTNTHQGFGTFGGVPVHTRHTGDTVGSDVRVSGRNPDGSIAYDGRSHNGNTGVNMLQSAAAPVTLGLNTAKNIGNIDSLTDWDGYTTLVTGLATDISKVQGMVEEYNAFVECITNPNFDPVQWLAGTLIDFLIQAFQPLEDLVGLVSGNETRMKDAASMWNTVAEAAPQVGDYIADVGEQALAEWTGQDGDAARTRVAECGEAVRAMGYMAVAQEAILYQMADVAKLLRQDVVDLIAKGVSWMLTRLLPQAAAAVATFGAWAASMVAQGIAKVASLVVKAVNSITKVLGIAEEAAKVIEVVSSVLTTIKPVLDFLKNNKHAVNMAGGIAEQATGR